MGLPTDRPPTKEIEMILIVKAIVHAFQRRQARRAAR
jgi:hypothetical protein